MTYWNELISNLMILVEIACMTLVFTGLFEKRDRVWTRYIIMACIAVCLVFGLSAVDVYVPGWNESLWEYVVVIFVICALFFVFLVVCYKGKPGNYIFHYMSAMLLIVALFAARSICIDTADLYMTGYSDSWLDRGVTLCITAILACFGKFFIVRGFDRSRTLTIENKYNVLYLLIYVIIFLLGTSRAFVESYQAKMFIQIGMLLCAIVFLYMQYIIFLRRQDDLLIIKQESEKTIAEQMSRQSLQLYNELKANMDIINIKCHDLKHKINDFGKSMSFDEDEIREIQKSIDIYNCNIRTGNEYLDVVLSNKSLVATENKITIITHAEGSCLGFMPAADIYSLFGNALDNAVEYVSTLPEDDRTVYLSVHPTGNLVSITVENPLMNELVLSNGIPQTHKDDKQNHGFGIKSMQRIAEKYDGDFQVFAEDGTFKVSILLVSSSDSGTGSQP